MLHFTRSEFEQRLARVQSAMSEEGVDGLLLFAPESHFWLTGYDTFGFALFQCMVVPASGEPHLLTRAPDLLQAKQTSTLADENIHIWKDIDGANPARTLVDLVSNLGLSGTQLGWETKTVGLSHWNGQMVSTAFVDTAKLIEASHLVSLLRRPKSEQEIVYHRRAAELSDQALDAAINVTQAGAFEGDILAAMQGAVFQGGGDYAGNEFIIGSGEAALLCRYQSGRRHLDPQDQLTLEWSGAFARYHAAMMRTLVIGKASSKQRTMHEAAVEALLACEEAIKPGKPMGDVFDAHARVFDERGLSHARLNACGYGMGAVYNPIWVDFPMFYEGNPMPIEVGNVFFLHMILMDADDGLAMCWGHSVLVTETGVERLSRSALELVEC